MIQKAFPSLWIYIWIGLIALLQLILLLKRTVYEWMRTEPDIHIKRHEPSHTAYEILYRPTVDITFQILLCEDGCARAAE